MITSITCLIFICTTANDRDALLRQYSLLLGRINALSTNLTDLAPIVPPDEPYDPSAKPASLRQYILTPLNPLPPNPDPLVQGTFFESLNTMPLLDVQNHTSSLLSSAPWKSAEELKTMSRPELEGWKGDLERRLKKEETTAEALERFIEETAEEYDWELRVDKVDEDGEDDLFDEPPEEQAEEEVAVEKVLPNPREGWEVKDYVRFLDTGVIMA